MNKRQLKMLETKKSLEEAINKILISKDFKDITIKEICSEANVAVGTFYNYYDSKEELVWHAIKRDSKKFNYIDNENVINNSLRENLIEFADCYCNYFKEKGAEYIKQIFVSKLNSTYENKCEDGKLFEAVSKLVKKAQDEGEISKTRSCEEVSDFIIASLRGRFMQWCLYEGKYDLYDRTIMLVDVMLIGLKHF